MFGIQVRLLRTEKLSNFKLRISKQMCTYTWLFFKFTVSILNSFYLVLCGSHYLYKQSTP